MAALWNIPIVFICENNHYGMGTAEWRHAKNSSFFTRGDYVPGLKVRGGAAYARGLLDSSFKRIWLLLKVCFGGCAIKIAPRAGRRYGRASGEAGDGLR